MYAGKPAAEKFLNDFATILESSLEMAWGN